jgi:hypothetical protein
MTCWRTARLRGAHIREERDTPKPGREWFWSLTITGAHRAGFLTWGYGASLEVAAIDEMA